MLVIHIENCIDDKGKFIKNKILQELIELDCFRSDGEKIYFHADDKHYWQDITEYANTKIKSLLPSAQYQSQLSSRMTESIVKDLIEHPVLQVDFKENNQLINLINGVYSLMDKKLNEYKKEYYFRYQLNFEYIENKIKIQEDAPNFYRFLQSSLNVENDVLKEKMLLQIIGYCISPLSGAKKMFFFVGLPNTGKSLILNLIEYAVGKDNRSIIGIHEISERFKLFKLSNSIVNLSHEVRNANIKSLDILKKMVANEPILVEQKGKDPKEITVKTKLVFCANSMPKLGEYDNQGISERLCVLLFNKKIDVNNRDIGLLEKMKKEVNVIFSVALKSLNSLIDNQMVFKQPKESKVFIEQYQADQDSLKLFIEDCCEINNDLKIHKCDFIKFYHIYCRKNILETIADRMIKQLLLENYPSITVDRFRVNGSGSLYGFKGIGLKQSLCNESLENKSERRV